MEMANEPDIAEHEIFFALNDAGSIGVGFTPDEARELLLEHDDSGVAIRSFSIRVRARKPHVELGPEIDIADEARDLPEASRASHHSS